MAIVQNASQATAASTTHAPTQTAARALEMTWSAETIITEAPAATIPAATYAHTLTTT